jgi:hypothetical protein
MPLTPIDGGYPFDDRQRRLLNTQKAISNEVAARLDFSQHYVDPGLKSAIGQWKSKRGTAFDAHDWIEGNNQHKNAGFLVILPWVDFDADGPPEFRRCMHYAFKQLGCDARLAFGRLSIGCPSHFLFRITDTDVDEFEGLRELAPPEVVIRGVKCKVEIKSSIRRGRGISAYQVIAPGSVYNDNKYTNGPTSQCGGLTGSPPNPSTSEGMMMAAATTPHVFIPAKFERLLDATAWGMSVSLLEPFLTDEGSRHDNYMRLAACRT